MVSWKLDAFLKTFSSNRSDEALRLTEKMEDQASDAADLNLRQSGKETTSN